MKVHRTASKTWVKKEPRRNDKTLAHALQVRRRKAEAPEKAGNRVIGYIDNGIHIVVKHIADNFPDLFHPYARVWHNLCIY